MRLGKLRDGRCAMRSAGGTGPVAPRVTLTTTGRIGLGRILRYSVSVGRYAERSDAPTRGGSSCEPRGCGMTRRVSLSLVVVLLGGGILSAEELKSGPPVGAKNHRTGFLPQFVAGPAAGETLCPV